MDIRSPFSRTCCSCGTKFNSYFSPKLITLFSSKKTMMASFIPDLKRRGWRYNQEKKGWECSYCIKEREEKEKMREVIRNCDCGLKISASFSQKTTKRYKTIKNLVDSMVKVIKKQGWIYNKSNRKWLCPICAKRKK